MNFLAGVLVGLAVGFGVSSVCFYGAIKEAGHKKLYIQGTGTSNTTNPYG